MSDPINDGGPAFPLPLGTANFAEPEQSGGMTLRDYFAANALQGLLAMQSSPHLGLNGTVGEAYFEHGRCDLMAKDAYALADAMLKSRDE